MNKEERKTYNKALTYHYLKQQDNGDEVVEEMDRRLGKAIKKDDDSGDVRVIEEDSINEPEKMRANRTLTAKYDNRTWMQRANIIFLFLHPQIGKRNTHTTAELTGVME
jgi:hypothetical protein